MRSIRFRWLSPSRPAVPLLGLLLPLAAWAQTPTALRSVAHDYYEWRNQQYPVASSEQGLHTWDDRLTDYSSRAVAARRAHVARLLARVRDMPAASWPREDYVDWLLFHLAVRLADSVVVTGRADWA